MAAFASAEAEAAATAIVADHLRSLGYARVPETVLKEFLQELTDDDLAALGIVLPRTPAPAPVPAAVAAPAAEPAPAPVVEAWGDGGVAEEEVDLDGEPDFSFLRRAAPEGEWRLSEAEVRLVEDMRAMRLAQEAEEAEDGVLTDAHEGLDELERRSLRHATRPVPKAVTARGPAKPTSSQKYTPRSAAVIKPRSQKRVKADPVALYQRHNSEWGRDGFLRNRKFMEKTGSTNRSPTARPSPKSLSSPATPSPQRPRKDMNALRPTYTVPTEKRRDSLRREVRSKMMSKTAPPVAPPKPVHRLVPNTYTPPTSKKRSDLVWAVRDLCA